MLNEWWIVFAFGAFAANVGSAAPTTRPSAVDVRDMDAEVCRQLDAELSLWYPRAVDPINGGFNAGFAADWSPIAEPKRAIVFQSRMLWTAATVVAEMPDRAIEYRPYVEQGVAYLANVMWDKQDGGFYWECFADGSLTPGRGGEKHAYGNAFAIYACAQAAKATHDPRALKLACDGFAWLDQHAHDDRNGGYFEALDRGGTPIVAATATHAADAIGTAYGLKSMNTHIHLMEAFGTLYSQWPDPHLKSRLEELFTIVRDRICVAPGCLNQYAHLDWRVVPALDSYGHDVETAFLLTDTAELLGRGDDRETRRVARLLVDHALSVGWDEESGGFYDEGPANVDAGTRGLLRTDKVWWVQAEGLNALLLMNEQYGGETDEYWRAAVRQWQFIRDHQIDAQHGGWWPLVARDGRVPAGSVKGSNWKAAYHTGRSLLVSHQRLARLAGHAS